MSTPHRSFRAASPASSRSPVPGFAPRVPASALLAIVLLLAAPLVAACQLTQPRTAQVGTNEKPLKMAFVPSSDSQKVLSSGEPIGRLLERETGLKVQVSVPTSYAAVI